MPARPRRSTLALALSFVAVSAIAGAGLSRRMHVVFEYRNFAGDGWNYFHLTENLLKDGRYAYGPAPRSLAWSRLPGYPLFLAASTRLMTNFTDQEVSLRVARVQTVLDMVTALFAFLIAVELGLLLPRYLALALCAASPLFAMCTAYILSETLAIFLSTTILYLLLRACRTRIALHLSIAGALFGFGMLVRADTLALAPSFLVPLLLSPEIREIKMRAALQAALFAALVFLPWPVRNVHRFGTPHPLGASWADTSGDELPVGVPQWIYTWSYDSQQSAQIAWPMAKKQPIYVVPKDAADDPEESKRVLGLLLEYSKSGLITPALDEKFRELAAERRHKRPFRHYLLLPLYRLVELWYRPVPDWELPINSPTLHLPEQRFWLANLTRRSLALALLGLVFIVLVPRLVPSLWPEAGRSQARALALLVVLTASVRSAVLVFVVPIWTQRYTLELLPTLLVLAAFALAAPAELVFRRLLARTPESA